MFVEGNNMLFGENDLLVEGNNSWLKEKKKII